MIDEDGWYELVMTEDITTSTLLSYTIVNYNFYISLIIFTIL